MFLLQNKLAFENLKFPVCLVFELLGVCLYTIYVWIWELKEYFLPTGPKSLAHEIILVTGGGNGIGRAICKALAKQESKLSIISWDVDEAGNQETIMMLKNMGVHRAQAYTVDVTDVDQVAAAAAKVRREIGEVTMLFNNAGVLRNMKPGWMRSVSDIKTIFDVNILSHIWTLREFLPNMVKERRGHIVETCSVAGCITLPLCADYTASQFAIRGYMESVKADLSLMKMDDIHISYVYPGFVDTNMTRRNENLELNKYSFLKHQMTPAEVASQIVSGVLHNKEQIYVPFRLRGIQLFWNVMPSKAVERLMEIIGIALPKEFSPLK